MDTAIIITALITIWGAISLISFIIGRYIIRKTLEDRELIETLIQCERGKQVILSFGNTFSVALTCMIPLVHIIPLIGFTYGVVTMKKDYEYYRECIIMAVKGE